MEDLRGMADEVGGGMAKHLKTAGIAVAVIIVVLALGWLALGAVNQAPITMSFNKATVKVGEKTDLTVTMVNTGESDASGVVLTVVPESAAITVTEATRTEATIGSKARREFKFTVGVSGNATSGSYKVTATVAGLGEKSQSASAYLEVE